MPTPSTEVREELTRRFLDVAAQLEVALIWSRVSNALELEYYKAGELFETAPVPQGMTPYEAFQHAVLLLEHDPWRKN